EEKWQGLLAVRAEVARALEALRREDIIGQSLQAHVELYARGGLYQLLEENQELLADLFIVSRVDLYPWEGELPPGANKALEVEGLALRARRIEGERCERCWKYGELVASSDLCPRCTEVMEHLSQK
ncbi:MAG: zinc finger domain-containing protein, partial [bacterium]